MKKKSYTHTSISILVLQVIFNLPTDATLSLVSHFHKPAFTNDTKNALRLFVPQRDIRNLRICHVLPFSAIDRKLAVAFLNPHDQLQPGTKINKDSIEDLKTDVYKIDSESAFLKLSDVRSKMVLFHENSNQRRDLEDELTKLSSITDTNKIAYTNSLQNILNYFYNAPANLRITPNSCINDSTNNNFEDPNLRSYTGSSLRKTLNDTEFTDHSRYLAQKYKLIGISGPSGAIRTTDRKKSERNPEYLGALKEYDKGLNVFQFFVKNDVKKIDDDKFMDKKVI